MKLQLTQLNSPTEFAIGCLFSTNANKWKRVSRSRVFAVDRQTWNRCGLIDIGSFFRMKAKVGWVWEWLSIIKKTFRCLIEWPLIDLSPLRQNCTHCLTFLFVCSRFWSFKNEKDFRNLGVNHTIWFTQFVFLVKLFRSLHVCETAPFTTLFARVSLFHAELLFFAMLSIWNSVFLTWKSNLFFL